MTASAAWAPYAMGSGDVDVMTPVASNAARRTVSKAARMAGPTHLGRVRARTGRRMSTGRPLRARATANPRAAVTPAIAHACRHAVPCRGEGRLRSAEPEPERQRCPGGEPVDGGGGRRGWRARASPGDDAPSRMRLATRTARRPDARAGRAAGQRAGRRDSSRGRRDSSQDAGTARATPRRPRATPRRLARDAGTARGTPGQLGGCRDSSRDAGDGSRDAPGQLA